MERSALLNKEKELMARQASFGEEASTQEAEACNAELQELYVRMSAIGASHRRRLGQQRFFLVYASVRICNLLV